MILLMFIGHHIPAWIVEANLPQQRSALDILTEEHVEEDKLATSSGTSNRGKKEKQLSE